MLDFDVIMGFINIFTNEGVVWFCFGCIMLLLAFVAGSTRASDSTQRSWSAKRKDKKVNAARGLR